MRIVPGNAQHLGSRPEQQDDFGFSDTADLDFISHGGVLALVTDGMGGLAQGREASLSAKQTMLRQYEEKSRAETIPQALIKALDAANASVVEMAQQAGMEGQIGTTLAAAVIKNDELYWISVGDSRIYLYRKGELTQLTTDHDYANHLVREVEIGNISPEAAATHPQRHALTSHLGLRYLREIDRNEDPINLEPGDRILLCSDGLYRTLPEEEIAQLLKQDPQHAADDLIELTLTQEKRSQDNVTVAILACEPEIRPDIFIPPPNFFPPKTYTVSKTYAKSKTYAIFITIVLFGIVGAFYLGKYLALSKPPEKAAIIDLKSGSYFDFQGPPVVQGEQQLLDQKPPKTEDNLSQEAPAKQQNDKKGEKSIGKRKEKKK